MVLRPLIEMPYGKHLQIRVGMAKTANQKMLETLNKKFRPSPQPLSFSPI